MKPAVVALAVMTLLGAIAGCDRGPSKGPTNKGVETVLQPDTAGSTGLQGGAPIKK